MKQLNYIYTLLITLVIAAACTTLPKNAQQTVYATYGAYVTVVDTTATLLEQQVITVDRAKKIQTETKQLRPLIDSSMAIVRAGGIPDGALMEQLQAAQKILLAIQRELQKEIKP